MKKIVMIVSMAIILIAGYLFSAKKNLAKTANFAVEVHNQEVSKGEEVTINVLVKSSVNIAKIEAYLNYDSEYLEFVSAREQGVVGASGVLSISETIDTPKKELSYQIVMRALEVGTTEVTIENIFIEDDNNSDVIEIDHTTAKVQITKNTMESTDAKLSRLLVFPGELNTPFEPNVTKYSVNVDSDVEEVIISAETNREDSTVTIDQPEVLSFGENTIAIHVTSQSGNERTYEIVVTRMK